ncbi:hypothetical protein H0H87_012942 [Tephrocybe sp. NHM501043]|nr:hypothetical protein H0H87_012942 [Tephrocybe sp. NHM501043]
MDSIFPESVLDTDSDGMAVETAFYNALDNSDNLDPDYTGEREAQESKEDEKDVEEASSDALVLKKKYKYKVVRNADSDRSVHAAFNIKHAKKLKLDSLQKDWQKQIVAKTLAHPIINNKDNDSNDNSSKEETQDSELSAVKNTRLSVKIEDVDVKASVTKSTSGAKYHKMPITCLPLPNGIDSYKVLTKWKTQFKATAINFTANLNQPFSANALLHNHVAVWWDLVYDFKMEKY